MSAGDPFVGTLFAGRFHIERPLAAGGMGAVYVAIQQPSGRKVALKLIKGAGAADPDMVARFHREIGVMSGLNHPNVVTMFDSGVDNGNVFLVMELLAGRSLRDEIEALRAQGQPRMPWPRALRITHHVARGLAAVHQTGVVHRDLKPDNIFMTTSAGLRDFAKLLDFGIVRHESMTETQRLTQTGGIIGTPGYLSPEQLTGSSASPLSDIYALGVILYELVTGEFPFNAPTIQAMAVKQLIGPIVPPGQLAPDLPEDVVALITALMARDPTERPSTESLLQRLEELLAETSGPVPRAPPYLGATEQMQREALVTPGGAQQAPTMSSDAGAGARAGSAPPTAPVSGAPAPLTVAPPRPTAPTEPHALYLPPPAAALPAVRPRAPWVAAGAVAAVVVVMIALLLLRNNGSVAARPVAATPAGAFTPSSTLAPTDVTTTQPTSSPPPAAAASMAATATSPLPPIAPAAVPPLPKKKPAPTTTAKPHPKPSEKKPTWVD